jgi:hypothetical protein
MGSNFYMIMAFSPALPAIAGLLAYKRVNYKIYPFIYAMWLSLITEGLSSIALRVYDDIYASFYIYYFYVCINISLYILFFYRMRVIQSKRLFWLLLTISLGVCIAAFFLKLRIYTLFGANLFCSAIILGLSTELITKQILDVKDKLYKKFSFLMSAGAILFNSFFIFLVAIWFLGKDDNFKTNVYSVQKFVNATCYIIFGISLLCLPKAKNFLK